MEERILAQKETKQKLTNSQIQNKHHKSLRRKKPTLRIKNKKDYLLRVNIDGYIKDKITRIYTFSVKNTVEQDKPQQSKTPHTKTKAKKERTKETQQKN